MAASPGAQRGPQRLSQALSELIAVRGYARVHGNARLQTAWGAVAGAAIARQTRAVAVKRGVLQVSVGSAALLSELVGYYRVAFLDKLRADYADLRIRDLKFRLDSNLKS
ncbi:MAG: DUF721 domain-containing protein [Planctomycetaceae bacterium]|nr:DUF721 domain-containing protein [Planctomycetaceae bacterium]